MEYRSKNEEIQEKLAILRDMRSKFIDEKRLPNAEESKTAKALLDRIEALEKEQKSARAKENINNPQSCWGDPPEKTPVDTRYPDGIPPGKVTREKKAPYEIRLAGDPKDYRSLYGTDRNEYQWRDKESTFFQALFSGRYHPELTKRGMTEGLPSGGGFLVPVEYSKKIHNISLENELVMPLATVQPMASSSIMLPAFEIGDHSSNLYGGFTASYTAEAGTMSDANPLVRRMELNAKKLTGFLRFSNELMQDTPNGESQILETCGKGLAWYRDKFFLKGTGAGQPLGLLNSPCLIAVSKEVGQPVDTIVYENLTNMMARIRAASFARSVWICHQTCIPQLLQLSISVGTGGSFIPVMNESNGKFTMLTRPVIFTEKTEVLGDQGDILLADLSQYVVGLRNEMRIDLSQHVYFTTDEGAARLIERHDGQALWGEALTLEDGSTTVSPFVTLEAR